MHTLLKKLAFVCGLVGIVGAIAIVAGQLVTWVQFDSWMEITVIHGIIALGWSIPATWFGVKAISTALNFPLSVVVLALGLALREIFAWLAVRCRGK